MEAGWFSSHNIVWRCACLVHVTLCGGGLVQFTQHCVEAWLFSSRNIVWKHACWVHVTLCRGMLVEFTQHCVESGLFSSRNIVWRRGCSIHVTLYLVTHTKYWVYSCLNNTRNFEEVGHGWPLLIETTEVITNWSWKIESFLLAFSWLDSAEKLILI